MLLLGIISLCILGMSGCATAEQPVEASDPHPSPASPEADTEFVQLMTQSTANMDADMTAPVSGNADVDFSLAMISHHQSSIAISRAFLMHGNDAQKQH